MFMSCSTVLSLALMQLLMPLIGKLRRRLYHAPPMNEGQTQQPLQ
jgi:hypothetical protein